MTNEYWNRKLEESLSHEDDRKNRQIERDLKLRKYGHNVEDMTEYERNQISKLIDRL